MSTSLISQSVSSTNPNYSYLFDIIIQFVFTHGIFLSPIYSNNTIYKVPKYNTFIPFLPSLHSNPNHSLRNQYLHTKQKQKHPKKQKAKRNNKICPFWITTLMFFSLYW